MTRVNQESKGDYVLNEKEKLYVENDNQKSGSEIPALFEFCFQRFSKVGRNILCLLPVFALKLSASQILLVEIANFQGDKIMSACFIFSRLQA